MTQFGGLGCVGDAYVRRGNDFSPTFLCSYMIHCLFTVYQQNGYRQLVNRTADLLMQTAVEEVKALPHYPAQGEVSVHPIVYIHIELITGYKFLRLKYAVHSVCIKSSSYQKKTVVNTDTHKKHC